jgi:hypothetical protein
MVGSGVGVGLAVGSGVGVGVAVGSSAGARATFIVTGWTSCGRATVPMALAGASTKKIMVVRRTIIIAPMLAGPNFCKKFVFPGFLFNIYPWLNRFPDKTKTAKVKLV